MDNIYRNFYRNFYLRTSFMATKPMQHALFPGDFFQIRNGEMITFGNIFRNLIIDPVDVEFQYGVKLNEVNWSFSDGISKPYSGRGTGHSPTEGEFEFSKQILAFTSSGSFIFKGKNPESVRLGNWNEIQQQLIIKLTQTLYSFRELYVVTESATASEWTLAISGSEKGELEIVTDTENFGLVDIFGQDSTRTVQSKDIEYYQRETKRKPVFFKAKKLAIQNEQMDIFMNELINQSQNTREWASNFYKYDFHYDPTYTPPAIKNSDVSILDIMKGDALNPETALTYFKWVDANLDDIEKLFPYQY